MKKRGLEYLLDDHHMPVGTADDMLRICLHCPEGPSEKPNAEKIKNNADAVKYIVNDGLMGKCKVNQPYQDEQDGQGGQEGHDSFRVQPHKLSRIR
jgi:hypothetical protein